MRRPGGSPRDAGWRSSPARWSGSCGPRCTATRATRLTGSSPTPGPARCSSQATISAIWPLSPPHPGWQARGSGWPCARRQAPPELLAEADLRRRGSGWVAGVPRAVSRMTTDAAPTVPTGVGLAWVDASAGVAGTCSPRRCWISGSSCRCCRRASTRSSPARRAWNPALCPGPGCGRPSSSSMCWSTIHPIGPGRRSGGYWPRPSCPHRSSRAAWRGVEPVVRSSLS